jgi:pimeloyl-ACP methyl ester carboxylesterase
MCDERERLIGYVYDECDAGERRLVEKHLEACETCREEIGGLRGVRTDLLAWDVPDHGSVWTPFVKARPTPWWREVPAWGLAAAASLMLLAGAAGGAATTAFLQHAPAAAETSARLTGVVAVPATVSPQDLTAMEQRLMSKVRGEIEQRVSVVSAHAQVLRAADTGTNDVMIRRMNDLLGSSEARQLERVRLLHNDVWSNKTFSDQQFDLLNKRIDALAAASPTAGR